MHRRAMMAFQHYCCYELPETKTFQSTSDIGNHFFGTNANLTFRLAVGQLAIVL